MRCSRPERRRGVTLLEVVVALFLLSIVVVLWASTFAESTDAGRVITTDAELRARAQQIIESVAKGLRQTRTSSVNVSGMSGTPRSMYFYPITGTTAASPYYTVAATSTSYSWDPTLTTGTGSWQLSTLILTPYDKSPLNVVIAREVTDFQVTAVGTTATSGFATTASQMFEIKVELSRRGVIAPTSGNPNGKISVSLTTRVSVQGG